MNVAATTAAEGFPRRAFTVDDIARMIDAGIIGEDEKFELIEGEIVMSAAKGFAHERIKSALTIAVVRALQQLPPDVWDRVDATGPPVVTPIDVSEAPSIAPLAIEELSLPESSEPSLPHPPSGDSR